MSSINPHVWCSVHSTYCSLPRRQSSNPEPHSIWRTLRYAPNRFQCVLTPKHGSSFKIVETLFAKGRTKLRLRLKLRPEPRLQIQAVLIVWVHSQTPIYNPPNRVDLSRVDQQPSKTRAIDRVPFCDPRLHHGRQTLGEVPSGFGIRIELAGELVGRVCGGTDRGRISTRDLDHLNSRIEKSNPIAAGSLIFRNPLLYRRLELTTVFVVWV